MLWVNEMVNQLSGIIELNEGFFSTETESEQKEEPLKRGRGSQKKSKVLVMAESTPVENPGKPGKPASKPRKVNHLKMFVITDLKAQTIDPIVSKNVDKEAIIDSDNSTSYTNFKEIVKEHRLKVIPST